MGTSVGVTMTWVRVGALVFWTVAVGGDWVGAMVRTALGLIASADGSAMDGLSASKDLDTFGEVEQATRNTRVNTENKVTLVVMLIKFRMVFIDPKLFASNAFIIASYAGHRW